MRNPWPESDPAVMAPVEEHEELRHVVRSLLQKYAEHESVRGAADSESGYSTDLWRRLNQDLEIGRLAMPEDRGGHGFGTRELGVVLEETGAALLPEPVLASAVLGARALAEAADAAALPDLLDAVMTGDRIATLVLDEADLEVIESADGWLLTGAAHAVLQGAAADVVVAPAAAPHGTVLVVAETSTGTVEPRTVVDLTRRRADLSFVDAPSRLLVGPDRVGDVLAKLRLLVRAAVAAEHTGIAAELLERTTEYVTNRQQFGRQIGSFQAIKHRLADVLVDVERARSASRYAAAVLDADPAEAELAVTIASAVCVDAVVRTAHEAVQLHGGIGFTWEHRAHYYLRRALGDEGLFGSSRERRARIADMVGLGA